MPAPVAHGLLSSGEAICGEDFVRTGPRTFEALGLAGLSREGMTALLRDGTEPAIVALGVFEDTDRAAILARVTVFGRDDDD